MGTDFFVHATYVEHRISSKEVNMLVSTTPDGESKSLRLIIGIFSAGLVAVISLAFVIKRRYRNGKKKERKDVGMMPADVENAVQLGNPDEDMLYDIDTQNSFYGHSISSASTQMVSNRRPKAVANPLYLEEGAIVEETLSDDESEDALPSFHPDCMCLGN